MTSNRPELLPNIRHQGHEAGALDGIFDSALEGSAGAAPLLAVQLALAGAELLEPLDILVIHVGRPRAALFGAEPTPIFSSPP